MNFSIFSPKLPKKQGDHRHWGNLNGSSLALAIANAAIAQQSSVMLVTADTPSAIKLEKELSFFLQSQQIEVKLFPDWETLPYDNFSPHQDIISQRLETLYQLTQNDPAIFIVPVNTLMQRMAPVDYLGKYLLFLKVGQTLDIDAFRQGLESAGYLHVSQVMGHSEFSVRGSIIDLFPMGSDRPFRIDLFDDEIDSIRYFDPDNQRSADKVEQIRLLPAREFPTDNDGIALFRQNYLQAFDSQNSKESVYSLVGKGIMPAGIEYYLPLFFEQTATLFDYLHTDTLVLQQGDLQSACKFYWQDLSERYEQHRFNPDRPLLPPAELFLRFEELFAKLKQWPRVSLQAKSVEEHAGHHNFATALVDDISINPQLKVPWISIKQKVKKWQQNDVQVLFSAESQGRRENLLEILNKAGIKAKAFEYLDAFLDSKTPIGICIGLAENSFILDETSNKLAFITETELLGHKISQRRLRDKRQATDENAVIRNLAELSQGQPVVHLDHGVGRYLGLQTLDAGGVTTEYLCIEYAKEAKLYVPVACLHLISRYSGGDTDHAPLHNLGSDT